MRILTITAILMVLMASLVFASNIDIDASAELPVYVCAPASYTMTLFNNGDAVIGVGLFSDVSYVTYTPQSFWIQPGSSQAVNIALNVPCDAKSTKLTTTISTTDDEFLYVTQKIIAYVPENIALETDTTDKNVAACSSSSLKAKLTNPINFTETYSFSVESIDGINFTLPSDITLEAGANQTVSVPFKINDCSQIGSYTPVLTVEALNTHVKASLPYTLNIDPSGVASYHIPAKISFTKPFTQKIAVTNLGNSTSEFIVKLSGADFVSASPSTLVINGTSTSIVDLMFKAPANSTTSNVMFTIQNIDTGNTYPTEFTVKYRQPSVVEKYWYIILIGLIVVSGLGYGFKYLYSYLMSPSMIRKRKMMFNERARIIMERLEAKFLAREKKKRAILRMKAEALRLREARLAKFSWKRPIFFVLSVILLAGIAISLYVFRSFVVPFTFNLLESYGIYIFSGIVLLAFAILTIRAISRRKPVAVDNTPANEKVAELVKAHTPVAKRVKIAESPKAVSAEIKSSSSKTWGILLMIAGLFIVIGAVMQYVPSLKEYTLYVVVGFAILLLLFIINWIFSRRKKKPMDAAELKKRITAPGKKINKRKVFAVLCIIVSLSGLFFLSPRSVDTSGFKGIPDQIISKNTDAFLDLRPFFKDPDNEALSYAVSGTDKVKIDIQDGVARFIPSNDFIGEETATFIATDSSGATVNSNQVRLIVKEYAFFDKFKTSFSIFLVVLFLLGVSLAVFNKAEKPMHQE